MMNRELLSFVRANNLIAPGDRVTCAVSGGPDSMCMLWAFYQIRDTLGITLACAHYDHGLRHSSAEDAAFVHDFCAEYGIPFVCGHGDVAAEARPDESIELAARRLRYAFLHTAAADGLIATAHTADDNLETVLLRLVRGTSLRGLGGIPLRRGRIIRPMLFTDRARVLEYLAAEGIPFRIDETNETDFCPRNRIRHHVIPLLRQENPGLSAQILSLSRTLRAEDSYLSEQANTALDSAKTPDGWNCGLINAMPAVLRRRVLFAILQEIGVPEPTERHAALLDDLVRSPDPSGQANFPGGAVLARQYDLLTVGASPAQLPQTVLNVPGTAVMPGFKITCSDPHPAQTVYDLPDRFSLSYDLVRSGLRIRGRHTGDRIQLAGGSRSLKRLMIDKKIPAARRDALPVLVGAGGIAAVAGIGANQHFLAHPGEIAVEIKIEKEDETYAE